MCISVSLFLPLIRILCSWLFRNIKAIGRAHRKLTQNGKYSKFAYLLMNLYMKDEISKTKLMLPILHCKTIHYSLSTWNKVASADVKIQFEYLLFKFYVLSIFVAIFSTTATKNKPQLKFRQKWLTSAWHSLCCCCCYWTARHMQYTCHTYVWNDTL